MTIAIPASVSDPWRTVTGQVKTVFAIPIVGPALKVVLGYLLLVEFATNLIFGQVPILGIGLYDKPLPRGVFVVGAVIGVLYALIGMGLILVYRANRIISFAQAGLGAVPAVIALLLVAKRGWPYLAVVPLMLAGAAALGAGVEVVGVRRFANSARLILTVVTIGLSLVLALFEVIAKILVGGSLVDTIALTFPTPFQSFRRGVGPVTLTGDHLFAVVVVAVLVVAVGAFFRFTDMGIAVRASAENSERAALLGIPVKRVSTVVWMLAAVLSAVGVFLRAPLVGLPLDSFIGPSVLLPGLAVAVMAKMENLPTAMFAGMLIGIIEQSTVFATHSGGASSGVFLVVIVVTLLLQRGSLSRAQELGASSWQAVKEVRPIPSELRSLPEVVRAKTVLFGVIGVLVVAVPWIFGDKQMSDVIQVVIFAMSAVSLVILTGWAGQISLGQFAFAGVGAAVAGGLAANHNVDFFFAVTMAGLAGALVAVVIGLPAVRIQGLFLAVTTLAFAYAVRDVLLSKEYFGWLLPEGNTAVERPVFYGKLDMNGDSKLGPLTIPQDAKFYYLCLLFLVLFLAVARSMRRNRSGRILIGTRDNGRVVQAFGVNLARTRLAAFAISGFMAAVAGALLAYQIQFFTKDSFGPEQSINIFLMSVIGGLGSLPGALMGALYVKAMPLLPVLRDVENISLLTNGVGLLLLLYFLPGGLSEAFFNARDNWLRRVAKRRGIHVPSLVADSLIKGDEIDANPITHAAEHASDVHLGEEQ